MLAHTRYDGDELLLMTLWVAGELPDDIDDWPTAWRARLEDRQDALADTDELEPGEALELAEGLVRGEFRHCLRVGVP